MWGVDSFCLTGEDDEAWTQSQGHTLISTEPNVKQIWWGQRWVFLTLMPPCLRWHTRGFWSVPQELRVQRRWLKVTTNISCQFCVLKCLNHFLKTTQVKKKKKHVKPLFYTKYRCCQVFLHRDLKPKFSYFTNIWRYTLCRFLSNIPPSFLECISTFCVENWAHE